MPKVLQPISRVTNGDMTQGIYSGVVDGRYLEQIKWVLVWTGAPQGAFTLQESSDYNPQISSDNGTWLDNGAGIAPPAGVSGSAQVKLSNQGPCFYRLKWAPTTPGSNAGSLNVIASGAGPK